MIVCCYPTEMEAVEMIILIPFLMMMHRLELLADQRRLQAYFSLKGVCQISMDFNLQVFGP